MATLSDLFKEKPPLVASNSNVLWPAPADCFIVTSTSSDLRRTSTSSQSSSLFNSKEACSPSQKYFISKNKSQQKALHTNVATEQAVSLTNCRNSSPKTKLKQKNRKTSIYAQHSKCSNDEAQLSDGTRSDIKVTGLNNSMPGCKNSIAKQNSSTLKKKKPELDLELETSDLLSYLKNTGLTKAELDEQTSKGNEIINDAVKLTDGTQEKDQINTTLNPKIEIETIKSVEKGIATPKSFSSPSPHFTRSKSQADGSSQGDTSLSNPKKSPLSNSSPTPVPNYPISKSFTSIKAPQQLKSTRNSPKSSGSPIMRFTKSKPETGNVTSSLISDIISSVVKKQEKQQISPKEKKSIKKDAKSPDCHQSEQIKDDTFDVTVGDDDVITAKDIEQDANSVVPHTDKKGANDNDNDKQNISHQGIDTTNITNEIVDIHYNQVEQCCSKAINDDNIQDSDDKSLDLPSEGGSDDSDLKTGDHNSGDDDDNCAEDEKNIVLKVSNESSAPHVLISKTKNSNYDNDHDNGDDGGDNGGENGDGGNGVDSGDGDNGDDDEKNIVLKASTEDNAPDISISAVDDGDNEDDGGNDDDSDDSHSKDHDKDSNNDDNSDLMDMTEVLVFNDSDDDDFEDGELCDDDDDDNDFSQNQEMPIQEDCIDKSNNKITRKRKRKHKKKGKKFQKKSEQNSPSFSRPNTRQHTSRQKPHSHGNITSPVKEQDIRKTPEVKKKTILDGDEGYSLLSAVTNSYVDVTVAASEKELVKTKTRGGKVSAQKRKKLKRRMDAFLARKNQPTKQGVAYREPAPKPVCRFYLRSACSKGSNCPFRHEGTPIKLPEACKYYIVDACNKGDDCPYHHESFPCKYHHSGTGPCRYGNQCKFSHDPLTEETRAMLDKFLSEQKAREDAVLLLHDNQKIDEKGKVRDGFDITSSAASLETGSESTTDKEPIPRIEPYHFVRYGSITTDENNQQPPVSSDDQGTSKTDDNQMVPKASYIVPGMYTQKE